ncbi:MAG: hypothetical protein RI907_2710 [Pseudomonadota bacterium]|jgi:hypothetical protein
MPHLRVIRLLLLSAGGWLAALSGGAATAATADNVGPAPTRYMTWEAIELPVSTGASCGNGSPYRFFVNRSLHLAGKANTAVVFEGGGACWEQNACSGFGKGGLLSATNPNGIPANYMASRAGLGALGLTSPIYTRNQPLQKVQTQNWNLVYLPYCTGDVHSGSKTVVYSEADTTKPLTYHHKGFVNAQAVAAWLAVHMAQPQKLLITGFSAGATGASTNYAYIRQAMAPKQSALLADSGPIFPAPLGGLASDYPSLPVQTITRHAWGLLEPGGQIDRLNRDVGELSVASLSDSATTVNVANARRFPQDRFGYTLYQRDGVYSEFSYAKFYPEIAQAGSTLHKTLVFAKWDKDIGHWLQDLQSVPNAGFYLPWKGVLPLSHCLTVLSFKDTGIVSLGLPGVGGFIDNLLDPSQPLMRAVSPPLP